MKRKLQQEYEIYLPSLDETVEFSSEEEYEEEDATTKFVFGLSFVTFIVVFCEIVYQFMYWAISLH